MDAREADLHCLNQHYRWFGPFVKSSAELGRTRFLSLLSQTLVSNVFFHKYSSSAVSF